MTTFLHIDSSANTADRSLTRQLGRRFFDRWLAARPGTRILRRDVGAEPVPAIDAAFIAAAFTAPQDRTAAMRDRLALSDRLIDEIVAADVIVMGAPMYNYGMPAALKGWFDQVARIGRTFSFDLARGDVPIAPILSGKRLVLLSARGEFGFAPGGMRAGMNALDPAIAACAHYLGIDRATIDTIAIEYQEFGDARFAASKAAAQSAVDDLVDRMLAERPAVATG